MFRFNGRDFGPLLLVQRIGWSLLPPQSVETIEVAGRAGSVFSRVRSEQRTLPVDVVVSPSNTASYEQQIRTLAGYLATEGPRPLEFDQFPGWQIDAIVSGSTDLETIVRNGSGTIEFLCPDPAFYLKADDVFTLTGAGTDTVTREGNAASFPLVEVAGESKASGTVTLRENLVPNPSFEYGTVGWSTFGDATLSLETVDPISGTQSLHWEFNTTGTDGWAYAVASGSLSEPSDHLYLQFRVRPDFTGKMAFDLGETGGSYTRIEPDVTAGVEQTITVQHDDTGMTSWYIQLGQSTAVGTPGSTAVIDQVMVSTRPITEYADGDSTSSDPDLTWGWSGTPGESTSVLVASGQGALTLDINGQAVTYTGTLATDETLVFDADLLTASVQEAAGGAHSAVNGLNTLTFPTMTPGENTISITTAGAATVDEAVVHARSRSL